MSRKASVLETKKKNNNARIILSIIILLPYLIFTFIFGVAWQGTD